MASGQKYLNVLLELHSIHDSVFFRRRLGALFFDIKGMAKGESVSRWGVTPSSRNSISWEKVTARRSLALPSKSGQARAAGNDKGDLR